jgi:hypothetical protein
MRRNLRENRRTREDKKYFLWFVFHKENQTLTKKDRRSKYFTLAYCTVFLCIEEEQHMDVSR